jgi:hypothetical protein
LAYIAGASHVDKENVGEEWLGDDQVSDMSVGRNGPVDRNEVKMLTIFNNIRTFFRLT